MNIFLQQYRSYLSFTASFILHSILLILLIVQRVYYITRDYPEKRDEVIGQRSTPAPIRIATPPKQQPVTSPAIEPEPLQIAEPTTIEESIPQAIEPEQSVAVIPESLSQSEPSTHAEESSESEESLPELPALAAPADSSTYALPVQQTSSTRPTTKRKKRRTGKRRRQGGITGKQLMQAFRQAYQYQQTASSSIPNNRSTQPVYGESATQYADRQLEGMRRMSYNTKVNKVLQASFAYNRNPIHFDDDLNTKVTFCITIREDGSVEEVTLPEPTGYAPLDEHILSVVKQSHFAPIPKHFNCNKYQFYHTAIVRISKGSGTVMYSYSQENI